MNDFATVCFFETAEIIVFFIVYLINCPEIYPRIVYSAIDFSTIFLMK